jgi:transcriptional regulator with XRE-family HTH domain
MARVLQSVDLQSLSEALKQAREAKGWTLQQLSHELWAKGFPTSQNKLWRLENNPPKRVDTELLLWLEKVLEAGLLTSDEPQPVLVEDVTGMIDEFIAFRSNPANLPERPSSAHLQKVYDRLWALAGEEREL